MNRDQARVLIADTFTQSFDKARFGTFVVNVLNHVDENKAGAWNSIKDAFKDHVHRYERLGTYTSPDNDKIDVLVVYLTQESKLERTRTAIRNFVADHLKTRDGQEAALVAFVSPTERQWRFSYVKMEYASVATESGKVGVETRLTPARRFSYLVGEGESCHTAQSRFLALLQDTGTNPTLGEIEEAFSVEAVTREFFRGSALRGRRGSVNRSRTSISAAAQMASTEHPAKQCSKILPLSSRMDRLGFLSECAGQRAFQALPHLRTCRK